MRELLNNSGGAMSGGLLERYDERIAGVLSCSDDFETREPSAHFSS
jgi:hypothetical protein